VSSKTTVGTKFARAGALILILTIAVGVVAERTISHMSSSVDSIVRDPLPGIDRIGQIEALLLEYRGDVWRHIATTDKNIQATLDQQVGQIPGQLEQAIKSYEETVTTDEDRTKFEKTKSSSRAYLQIANAALALSREGRAAEASDLYVRQAAAAFDATKANVKEMVKLNRDIGERDGATAREQAASGSMTLWLLLAAAVLSGAGLLFFILRSLNRQLRQATATLGNGAGRVADSAAQIASSSQALAEGASEQAASLEETSASMEEINSMAKRNSDNSRSAAELVNASAQKFGEANQLLERTETAMGEIHASSGKISKIIKTIDEIAFQTNILALNAAVEAARAGEAGMGFAVVADEVRNLAQRSAQAARDTAALIEESIEKSNGGKTMVEQVANAIRTITDESMKIKTLVDEVNLGSQEQTRGIEQIARAVTEMERVTQRTAAGAEQSASAAQELTSESRGLKAVVEEVETMVGRAETGAPKPEKRETAPAKPAANRSAVSHKADLQALKRVVAQPPTKAPASPAVFKTAAGAFPLDDSEFEQM
jgi:methyl-accepting chemotaxis protein